MVKKMRRGGKTLYVCEICGLAYQEPGWADKCESWCREHEGSCSLEVAGHAEPPGTQ
ncbi:MAG: hypothetical protein HYX83_02195 [Chloroflexi bacterium]|nr:hypothetical protein [Chloroflexota bacterium]